MSLKALPTDFLRYLLSCALCLPINAMAIDGFSLKNGRLVQILNPSVTARITFGLSSFSHSSISGKDTSYPPHLQTSSKAIASISCTRQFLSVPTVSFRKQRALLFSVANQHPELIGFMPEQFEGKFKTLLLRICGKDFISPFMDVVKTMLYLPYLV